MANYKTDSLMTTIEEKLQQYDVLKQLNSSIYTQVFQMNALVSCSYYIKLANFLIFCQKTNRKSGMRIGTISFTQKMVNRKYKNTLRNYKIWQLSQNQTETHHYQKIYGCGAKILCLNLILMLNRKEFYLRYLFSKQNKE